MLEKTVYELEYWQVHGASLGPSNFLLFCSRLFITQGNRFLIHFKSMSVGGRGAEDITAEILNHLLWTFHGGFTVDHPFHL